TYKHRGALISFGVFQTYYAAEFDRSASDISWIGSIQVFLLLFMGGIAGSLTDAGYGRLVLMAGASLIVLGTLATSAGTAYWQVLLSQGICTGLGNGLLFAPVVSIVSVFFQKRRALAIALSTCGSAVGGLVFPSMARELLAQVGFPWAMRAIGILQAGTLVIAVGGAKPPARMPDQRKILDLSVFHEMQYDLFTFGLFLVFTGLFVPFFSVANYAREVQGASFEESTNYILVLNGVGVVSRLLPGILSLRIGTYNVYCFAMGSTALVVYFWTAVTSKSGLIVWTIFFSLCMGGIQSLFPAALSTLRFEPLKQGTRTGMMTAVVSFGALIGPPVASKFVSQGHWVSAELFAASCILGGLLFTLVARELKRREQGWSLLCAM
ncbi:hypothetical protein D0865_14174, partial [Hortaea werneckii]